MFLFYQMLLFQVLHYYVPIVDYDFSIHAVSPKDGVLIISVGQPGVETTVSLLCLSQGGPWNVYTWNTAPSDDSEFTSNFAENVAVNGAELIIKNVRFNSDRLYKCEVTNSAGSGSDVISLVGKYC